MKVIIVAGGEGKRLRPLTENMPKPMVDVNGKSILEHTVDLFKKHGFTDFIFALCYKPQVIVDYFGDGSKFGVTIDYTYEDPDKPLGTAGAITLAKDKVTDTFIVTYADILRELDITAMVKAHQGKNAFATLNVYKRLGADPKSMVLFDEDNRITEFVERPAPELLTEDFVWANGSFYILDKDVFNYIAQDQMVDFGKDIFPALLKDSKALYAFPTEGYFVDIGDIKKLEKARATYKPD